MPKILQPDRKLVFLFSLALLLKLFSLNEGWVEKWYTYGIYPKISSWLRLAFGWFPGSVGDVLYAVVGLFILYKLLRIFWLFFKRRLKQHLNLTLLRKYLRLLLGVYIVFQLLWGLNYNRQGIATQLQLTVEPYTTADLVPLVQELNQQLCIYSEEVDSFNRLSLDKNVILFKEGEVAYQQVTKDYPFLKYQHPSIKPSLYSSWGQYIGFTGYYNPFSAEAQLKISIPVFLKPFVVCHEIAHQVGYAKENEANFVSFLVSRQSKNAEFRYSAYFEMFLYSWRELLRRDPKLARLYFQAAHPQVKEDYKALRRYLRMTNNNIEPYMSLFYDRYLKLNNQPKGKATYNEVVSWLVALAKKEKV